MIGLFQNGMLAITECEPELLNQLPARWLLSHK